MPGKWYGVGHIAHVMKKCNRLYRPMCDDFQIVVQNEGNVWFEKIAGKMQKKINVKYNSKDYGDLSDEDDREQKFIMQESVETVFSDEIERINNYKNQFRVLVDSRIP